MSKSMESWFFMRPGFSTFAWSPTATSSFFSGHRSANSVTTCWARSKVFQAPMGAKSRRRGL